MQGFTQERRGLFGGLKVPALDITAIALAFVALLLFQGGVRVIAGITTTEVGPDVAIVGKEAIELNRVVLGNVLHQFGTVGRLIAESFELPHQAERLQLIQYLLYFGWAFLLWAFFSAALTRIAAMRIAREESLSTAQALGFALRKCIANIIALLFVPAVVFFFYFIVNTLIVGSLSSIPYVGSLFLALFSPVVLVTSAAITFFVALGLLGFNLCSAAIATEASDAFDGISRAWGFILSRPWQFLLTNGLIVAFLAIFLFFGGLFVRVSVGSLSTGGLGLGSKAVQIDAAEAATLTGDPRYETGAKKLVLPGKGEYLYKRAVLRDDAHSGAHYLQAQLDGHAVDVLTYIKKREWGLLYYIGGIAFYLVGGLKLLVLAFALNYFFAGQTAIYFLLRYDVDGDDYSEINLDIDEDGDPFNLPNLPATPASPSAPPSSEDSGGKGRSLPMAPMEV